MRNRALRTLGRHGFIPFTRVCNGHASPLWKVSYPGDETCRRAPMTESLLPMLANGDEGDAGVAGLPSAPASGLTEAQARLRRMVLDAVTSPHSRRNYAKALDDLFAFAAGRPLTRALLQEWRASMAALAPSTVNVRLSAVRKLVGEAHKNGMLGSEEAEHLTDVPNIQQRGSRTIFFSGLENKT
jgi:hypothetical protein